ncbi:unnamed protein product [Symbiodinium sp. CCMP2592]|nr:unnamed protein product [Symbiodinium sp. CCMP2592]
MASLHVLIGLWTTALAIRQSSEPSEFDAKDAAAYLNQKFQNGTDSENLAEAGVLVRVFFESWTYVHGQSQLNHLAVDGVSKTVAAAHSWDDVVSIHKQVMSASLLNAGLMEDYGLDLWPHGVCGLVLNSSYYEHRWRCFYPADGCSDCRDGSGCGARLLEFTSGGQNCFRTLDSQKCDPYPNPSCALTEWSAFRNWKCSGCAYRPAANGYTTGGLVEGLQMQRAWKDTVRECGSFNVTEHFHGLTYNEVVLPYTPESADQVSAVFCRTVPVESTQYRQSIAAAAKLRDLYESKFAKPIPLLAADFSRASPFSPL